MNCSECGSDVPSGAKFCMTCGHAVATVCTNCGTDLPAQAAFCFSCGTKVSGDSAEAPAPTPNSPGPASGPPDQIQRLMPPDLVTKLETAARSGAMNGERRTVTMLFCDVAGSTAAAEQLDPEEWTEVMNGVFEHLMLPIYRYEGTVANLMGDAILAFFGAPLAHEDDPERAVKAGLEMVRDIQSYRAQVKRQWGIDFDVRVGINTGLVVVGAVGSDLKVQYTAMGDAVNTAARMEQTAAPSTVQISDATYRLVDQLFVFENLGPVEVKGKAEPVASYRVIGQSERPESIRGIKGLATPLVGREAEMRTLTDAFSAVNAGSGRIISVTGEAGLGKSRLIAELKRNLANGSDTATIPWHAGRSLSYEISTPYVPVRRILRSIVGLGPDAPATAADWGFITRFCEASVPGRVASVAPYLAWMLGVELPADQQDRIAYLEPARLRAEGMRATVEILEALVAVEPVVLFFEDLHWADEASLDVVTELLRLTDRSSLVLVLAFRPRHDEGSWRVHETAARDHPHRYTNVALLPLEYEQTRELVAGLLAIDALPDEVRNLILTRADGNPLFVEEIIRSMMDDGLIVFEGDRWVAHGDLVNVTFPATVEALLTARLDRLDEAARVVGQAASVIGRRFYYDELAALVPDVASLDQRLLELQRRELIREVARIPKRSFEFRHALVQEAAYRTILLRHRVQLHAGIADFIERFQPDRVEDIADHLVASHQMERALPYLVGAGERAAAGYATSTAIFRFEAAVELIDDSTDIDLVQRALEGLGQVKESLFDIEGAVDAYGQLRKMGEERGHAPMLVSGANKLAFVRGMFMGDRGQALEDVAHAEQLAREQDDHAGLAESCVVQCYLHTPTGEFDEVHHYMTEVIRHGEATGHDHAALFGMTHLSNALVLLARFADGLEQAEKTLARAEEQGNLRFQAEVLTFAIPVASLHLGNGERVVDALERGMEIALRIGDRSAETFAAVLQGKGAMMQGYVEQALALFQRSMEAADATGIPYLRALSRCVTGTAYLQVGGPMIERALEYHDETSNLMEMPTGKTYGTWMWSEMGTCALAARKIDHAQSVFDLALKESTATMFLMRPAALLGACQLALSRGQVDRATELYAEADEYVTSHAMAGDQLLTNLQGARLQAAVGAHDRAIDLLDESETLCDPAMRRVLLEVLAVRRRSLMELGRVDEAKAVQSRGQAIAAEIASLISDAELRAAFDIGSAELLGS